MIVPCAGSYYMRIRLVHGLLKDSKFRRLLHETVMAILRGNQSQGKHPHVAMVLAGNISAGSLRQSLPLALEAVIIQVRLQRRCAAA